MPQRAEAVGIREQMRAARERRDAADAELRGLAPEAKAAGIPVAEIAGLLGFKTRKAVYDLIRRGP